MKIRSAILLLVITMLTGCYGPLTGTVIDAETKKPIEGAVVYAEWVVTKGIGFSHTERYKTVETETDKDGKFRIEGAYSLDPSLELFTLVVYKPGYVAWQNKFIYRFPEKELRKRTDFHWFGFGHVFELEKFKETYSHAEHLKFFSGGISLGSSSKLEQAISWEFPFESKELDLYRVKIESKKYNNKRQVYQEIMNDLHIQDKGSK